jgi:cytoskeletal protein CcmA (bactofilin family)
MFNEKEKSTNKIDSLLGEHCNITGDLAGDGILKIDGEINGNINWNDDIILGFSSYCKGNISCRNAVVNGKVDGNIICENTLTIEGSGNVKGDVTMKNIVIHEGGSFEGKCTMVTSKNANDLIE